MEAKMLKYLKGLLTPDKKKEAKDDATYKKALDEVDRLIIQLTALEDVLVLRKAKHA